MKQNLEAQTGPESILRQIAPAVGPICRTTWKTGFVEKNRRIYDYELVYFAAGKGRVITENGTIFCQAKDAVIIPPGLVHCTVSDTPMERWCLHFDWNGSCKAHCRGIPIFVYVDSGQDFESGLMADPPPEAWKGHFPLLKRFSPVQAAEMTQLIRDYFLLAPENAPDEIYRHGLLYQILGLVLSGDSLPMKKSGNPRFFKLKNRVDTHLGDPGFSIAALAREMGVTPNHLTKVFRESIGLPLQSYLIEQRLRSAIELLQKQSDPVKEISFACGFSDPNYFSRCFRKKIGMSPQEFRRNCQSGEDVFETGSYLHIVEE